MYLNGSHSSLAVISSLSLPLFLCSEGICVSSVFILGSPTLGLGCREPAARDTQGAEPCVSEQCWWRAALHSLCEHRPCCLGEQLGGFILLPKLLHPP